MADKQNVQTDPKAESSDVKNTASNAANDAHPGNLASNINTAPAGNSTTNTSTGLKGAGSAEDRIGGSEGMGESLKTPRKQDGPAHTAPGGSLHQQTESHNDSL